MSGVSNVCRSLYLRLVGKDHLVCEVPVTACVTESLSLRTGTLRDPLQNTGTYRDPLTSTTTRQDPLTRDPDQGGLE